MDFNDTPEEAKFRAEARAFLEVNCRPKAAENDRMNRSLNPAEYMKAAKAYQKKKAEAGFAGITWAKEQGGRGLPPIFAVIFNQEEAKFDAPAGVFAIGLGMCVPTVIAFSDEATKDRYVAKALRGEEIWCQLFSEPGAGSDVAASKTKAVRDGDDWVVNGQKSLDHRRALLGFRHPPRTHQSRRGEAQGPLYVHCRHEGEGRGCASDPSNVRWTRFQRSVLHRRSHPRQEPAR